MALIDLTEQKFHRWAVERLTEGSGKVKYWDCLCDCGERKSVFGSDLKRGGSKSCGCLTREVSAARLSEHGMSFHAAYRNWIQAKSRCYNVSNSEWKNYGKRRIRLCREWQTFEGFWKDMGPTWQEGLTLDRISNRKGYAPDNCRWATSKEQANNRRDNHPIDTPKGRMNITQAAEEFGINPVTLFRRVYADWPTERLFDPVQFNMRWHKPKETLE